mgnify:CR=1 FL=1
MKVKSTKKILAVLAASVLAVSAFTACNSNSGNGTAGSADTSVSDVKTGDADNMAVYSLAALLAMAAGAAVVSRRRFKDVR